MITSFGRRSVAATTTRGEATRSARRPLVALAVVAVVAVAAAGCASAPAETDTAGRGGPNSADRVAGTHDQAVAFAECMRSNGVREFPDPDASGELTIDAIANGSSVDPSSAAFEQALGACKDLQPPGFTGHERNAQQQADGIAFAQCVRHNGVADFPDPDPDGPLVDTNRIPSLARSDDLSVLDAAMRTCHDVIADQLGER